MKAGLQHVSLGPQIQALTISLSLPCSNAKRFPGFEMEIHLIKKYKPRLKRDIRYLRSYQREKGKIKALGRIKY